MQSEFMRQELKGQQGKWALLEPHVLWKICSSHTEISLIFPPRRKSEIGGTKTQQDSSTAQWIRTGIIHDLILLTATSLQLLTWSSGSKRQWLMLGNLKPEPCCHLYIRDKFRRMMWGQICKYISEFLEVSVSSSRCQLRKSSQNGHIPTNFSGFCGPTVRHSSIHNKQKKRNLLRMTQILVAWNVSI